MNPGLKYARAALMSAILLMLSDAGGIADHAAAEDVATAVELLVEAKLRTVREAEGAED